MVSLPWVLSILLSPEDRWEEGACGTESDNLGRVFWGCCSLASPGGSGPGPLATGLTPGESVSPGAWGGTGYSERAGSVTYPLQELKKGLRVT